MTPVSACNVLEISGLTLDLGGRRILGGVDLALQPGRIHGLAGESGSGKTMTGLATLGLLPPGARTGGRIEFEGTDLLTLPPKRLGALRGRVMSMVFQDPSTSLHPMLSIGHQLTDHLRHHLKLDRKAAKEKAAELLAQVRIPNPREALGRYPHQFSGGMRQRIAIAIALACEPKVLIADEPTTALDVTVQAGVLRLLRGLCDDLGLAVLLVTHDLGRDVRDRRRGERDAPRPRRRDRPARPGAHRATARVHPYAPGRAPRKGTV